MIRSETGFVFNVTRTQLFGPEDLDKVKEIQASYGLQPLSAFLGTEAPAAAPQPDFPQWEEGAQFDERFFAYLDFMMGLLGSPAKESRSCGTTSPASASARRATSISPPFPRRPRKP